MLVLIMQHMDANSMATSISRLLLFSFLKFSFNAIYLLPLRLDNSLWGLYTCSDSLVHSKHLHGLAEESTQDPVRPANKNLKVWLQHKMREI